VHAVAVLARQQASHRSNMISHGHTHCHGDTVRNLEVRCGLDGMSETVAVVEYVSATSVELVDLNVALLD
jgi:hypothetical protein